MYQVSYKTQNEAFNFDLWVNYKSLQSVIDFAVAFSSLSDKKISVFEDGKSAPSFVKWNLKKEA